jgi:ABC-type transport system involved in cytochrome bd biosynthesis fused ATPase/permease subunit
MLVAKLGGLLGRRVYHMPIARSLKFGEAEAEEIASASPNFRERAMGM